MQLSPLRRQPAASLRILSPMTLWRTPSRTTEAQRLAAEAAQAERSDPGRLRLDANTFWAKAAADDLDAPAVQALRAESREALRVYLDSAVQEGRLSALGRQLFGGSVVERIRARIALDRALRHDPRVRERTIVTPIFVVGAWRTGTTLLHRLLALHPRLRALQAWELSMPWQAAGATADLRTQSIERAQRGHDRLRRINPEMMVVHEFSANLPEECILAMGSDFRSWFPTCQARLPGYQRWLESQDFEPSYRLYRDILRLLQEPDGWRFVLKAPAHTPELASLLRVFADAVIVHLHRDPVSTVASSASLFAVYRSTYSDDVDPVDIGRTVLDQLVLWRQRAAAARAQARAPGSQARWLDLSYDELVAEPVATTIRLCQSLDLEADAALARRFAEHLEHNRQHKLGRHRYTPEQFGLDPGEIRERIGDPD